MKKIVFLLFSVIFCFGAEIKGKVYLKNGIVYNQQNQPVTGSKKQFSKSGILMGEATFKNGLIHGIQKLYYNSGELNLEGRMKKGKAQGVQKVYYKSGKLQNTVTSCSR